MRTQRSIRYRGKREKREVIDLDITSLLDILVIMLVFLLKSYNSSGIVLNVPKSINLPTSESISVNSSGINVQVSKEAIYVDEKVVYESEKSPKSLQQMTVIYPLYNELVRKKQIIKQIQKTTPEAKQFSGMINLVLDKSIRYKTIQKLMHTCASAGFKTYKFVVLGEDN